MERLPENNILNYNADTLVDVRRLYNLDKPGQMDEAIDILDIWLKKQNHFMKKDYPREYLERLIIMSKGSVERAKSQMDKICTLRTLLPHFFDEVNIKKAVRATKGYAYTALLPKMTKEHYRIFMAKMESFRLISTNLVQIFADYTISICEYVKAHEYNDGFIAILDLRCFNIMEIVSRLNLLQLKQVSTILSKGYDIRVMNIFVISKSKTIDYFIKLFKQMSSEKVGKRLYVIEEIEELHEHISKELLPSDYGGDEKPLAALYEELLETLKSEENVEYLNEICKARTNESMRTSSNYNEELLGVAGTFRTLNID